MENTTPSVRKPRRWPWVVGILVVLFVVVPVVLLGWTGLFHIPVISTIFGTSKPMDLGVHPTPVDLQKALADNPMTFIDAPGTWSGMSVKRYTGTVAIDDENTSAEVTAFIKHIHSGKYARDIQVKYHEGGMELSAFVLPFINAPAYANVGVMRTSPTSVAVTVRSAKVGRLTIPTKYYGDIAREATNWINQRLAEVPGLSLDVVEYHDGFAKLKGTLQKSIEQVPGKEYTIDGLDLKSH